VGEKNVGPNGGYFMSAVINFRTLLNSADFSTYGFKGRPCFVELFRNIDINIIIPPVSVFPKLPLSRNSVYHEFFWFLQRDCLKYVKYFGVCYLWYVEDSERSVSRWE
jgi:hypothetical protein